MKWDWKMMMNQTWIPTQAPWIFGQLSYLAPAIEWLVWLSHSSHLNYWYSNLSDRLIKKKVQVDKINELVQNIFFLWATPIELIRQVLIPAKWVKWKVINSWFADRALMILIKSHEFFVYIWLGDSRSAWQMMRSYTMFNLTSTVQTFNGVQILLFHCF